MDQVLIFIALAIGLLMLNRQRVELSDIRRILDELRGRRDTDPHDAPETSEPTSLASSSVPPTRTSEATAPVQLRPSVGDVPGSVHDEPEDDTEPDAAPVIPKIPVTPKIELPYRTPAAQAASSTTAAPTPEPESTPTPASPPTATTSEARAKLESFIGGRLLLVIGVIAVLLALAFLFKLGIDRGFIGPAARLALGVTAGLLALLGGDRLRARGYRVYGHAIMGAGLGALFLCTFVAALRYDFINREMAFVLSALLAAAGSALAIWRDAPLLAWLGFLGGFMAPALLGRNEDSLGALTAWLMLLQLGVTAVLVARPWVGLDVFAAAASLFYVVMWRERWYSPDDLGRLSLTLGALQLGLLLLSLAPAWIGRRAPPPHALLLLVVGTLAVFGIAHPSCWPEHRLGLAAACAGLGLLALLISRAFERRHGVDELVVPTLHGLGLGALTVAIGLALRDDALPIAWAASAVVAMFIGVRAQRPVFRVSSGVMLALAIITVIDRPYPWHEADFTPVFNATFLSMLAPCLALLIIARLLERSTSAPARRDELLYPVLGLRVAGAWGCALILGLEVEQTSSAVTGISELTRGVVVALTPLMSAYAMLCALIWGRREPNPGLIPAGPFFASVVLALIALSHSQSAGFTPVFNGLFGAGLTAALAAVAIGRLCPEPMRRIGWVVSGVLPLALLTREIHAWGQLNEFAELSRSQLRLFAQMGISSLWTAYGTVLLVAGFRRELTSLRWAGLSLLLITVGKVFLFDLAQLDTLYRVGSFLVLGVLLVGASFLYQRGRARDTN